MFRSHGTQQPDWRRQDNDQEEERIFSDSSMIEGDVLILNYVDLRRANRTVQSSREVYDDWIISLPLELRFIMI